MEDLDVMVTDGLLAGVVLDASLVSRAEELESERRLSWWMETLRWMLMLVSSALFLPLTATPPVGFLIRSSCMEDLLARWLISMLPRSIPTPLAGGAAGGGGRLSLAGSLSWRA